VRASGGPELTTKETTAVCPLSSRASYVDQNKLQACEQDAANRQQNYNNEIPAVLKNPAYQTYQQAPSVPRVNLKGQQLDKSGNPVVDTDGTVMNGGVVDMRPGLKTLYIIQDVETKPGCDEQYAEAHPSEPGQPTVTGNNGLNNTGSNQWGSGGGIFVDQHPERRGGPFDFLFQQAPPAQR
jgi:hypothetical protein